MEIRRVVTGKTPQGTSVVVGDERIPPTTVALVPGGEFHRIWGSDEIVKLPSGGEQPSAPRWYPPEGGFRFSFVTFPPEGPPPDGLDVDAAMAEMDRKLPGLADGLEPDFMHTSDTIDFALIVSGEIVLELDDGVEVLLHAGDCVVQNGARHNWHNRTAEACVVAAAMVGAHPSG